MYMCMCVYIYLYVQLYSINYQGVLILVCECVNSGLDREEKLIALGSRNFFLCPRKADQATESGGGTPQPSCSKQAEKGTKMAWLKLMDFLF